MIRAVKECIEYVIAHKLCHLRYLNHGKKFYALLEERMPDWKQRKNKLEKSLI